MSERGNYRGRNFDANYRSRSRTNDDYRPRGTNSRRYNQDDSTSYRPRYQSNRGTNDSNDGYVARPRYTNTDPRPRYTNTESRPRSTTYRPRNYNDTASADTGYRPRAYESNYRPRRQTDEYQSRSNTYSNDRGPRRYQARGYNNNLQGTSDLIQTFSSIVQHRFRQDINCLDLSNISIEPLVKQKNINFFESQSNAMPALIKYVSENLPKLDSLNLSQNPITNTACLYTLDSLKNLKNLSLQGTTIRLYSDLDHMNAPMIKNLLLKDTPLYTSEKSKGGSYYQDEILKRFPSLKILDDIPIKGIEFEVPVNVFPLTILPGHIIEKEQVIDFIGKYFSTFDTNREVLQQIYTPDAYFSIQLYKPKNGVMSDYAQYKQLDRNLKFNKDSQKRFNSVFYGNEIGPALMMLPGTIHSFLSHPNKILFDSFISNGLFIIIHSEFQDLSTSLQMGFDRVFLLTPDFKIKSDMLTIREATQLPLSKPSKLNDQQYEMLLHFIKETGLNMELSLTCLEEHQFDLQRAKETFIRVKQSGQLPEGAFSI